MAKTRSQTSNITVKKEEEDIKDTQLLHSVNNTARNNKKITKRKVSRSKSNVVSAQKVKVEENTDVKPLLKSASKHSKLPKRQRVSQEQINQLIDYVVNHGMSVNKAASKANISSCTGFRYYNEYKNDPDKKIPLPRKQRVRAKEFLTQEQVENLIRYIVDEKMTVRQASAKANMACDSGYYHYRKYLKNPDHSIPILLNQHYTQDQKNELIGYIVNGKMSVNQASKKAKINNCTARKYCYEYFKDQHPDIPTPSHIIPRRDPFSQEQISKVISYIIDDKMTIMAASRKANMHRSTVGRHYHQYLKDNNVETPVSISKYSNRYKQEDKDQLINLIVDEKMTPTAAGKKLHMSGWTALAYYHQYLNDNNLPLPAPKHTQDQFDEFIGYIFDDKMNIKAASRKAKMPFSTAYTYLQRYLKTHNLSMSSIYHIAPSKYTQDKIDELIGYIVGDKMTVKAASKKANMSHESGKKYYLKYRKDHNLVIPIKKRRTQDQIDELISYIVRDKMTILAASKKANMSHSTGYRYYHQYLENQKRDVPARRSQVISAPRG